MPIIGESLPGGQAGAGKEWQVQAGAGSKDGRESTAGKEWQVQAAELKALRKLLADEKAHRESESKNIKKWEQEMQAIKEEKQNEMQAAAKRKSEEEKQNEKQARYRENSHRAILRRLDGLVSSVKAETSDRVSAISGVRKVNLCSVRQ